MSKVLWNSSFHHLLISVILLCVVDQVYSGVTSSFIRSEWPAVDIPIDSEEFAVPKDQNAPQQVHITQGDYDGKSIIVSWVTIIDSGTSEVLYGKSQNKYDHSAQGKTTNYTYYDYKSGYIHHCLLDGLEYDTKYYYKVGTGDSAREFWFQTPPKINLDAPYTFGIIDKQELYKTVEKMLKTEFLRSLQRKQRLWTAATGFYCLKEDQGSDLHRTEERPSVQAQLNRRFGRFRPALQPVRFEMLKSTLLVSDSKQKP